MGGTVVEFGDGTSIRLFDLAVAPRYLALPCMDELNDLVGIMTMLGYDILDIVDKLRDLDPPLSYALRSELFIVQS